MQAQVASPQLVQNGFSLQGRLSPERIHPRSPLRRRTSWDGCLKRLPRTAQARGSHLGRELLDQTWPSLTPGKGVRRSGDAQESDEVGQEGPQPQEASGAPHPAPKQGHEKIRSDLSCPETPWRSRSRSDLLWRPQTHPRIRGPTCLSISDTSTGERVCTWICCGMVVCLATKCGLGCRSHA